MYALRDLFGINTQLVYQSAIDYCRESKKNDLVLELCEAVHSEAYLSGTGAKKYMELDTFTKRNIAVEFQEFSCPQYQQAYSPEFIPNLSSLDLLFNCGIEKSREVFWNNIINV